jgi:uncharacterized protein YrrD
MVKRSSELIGKPVVASDSGKRLGFVADLLVDDADSRVVGLVLRHGWLNTEEVLPAAYVQTLGADAIVSRSSELIGAKQWREQVDHPAVNRDQTHDGPFEG